MPYGCDMVFFCNTEDKMSKLYRFMLIVLLSFQAMAMKKEEPNAFLSIPEDVLNQIFVFFIIKDKPEMLLNNIIILKKINKTCFAFGNDILPEESSDYMDIPEQLHRKFNKINIVFCEKHLSVSLGKHISCLFAHKKHNKIVSFFNVFFEIVLDKLELDWIDIYTHIPEIFISNSVLNFYIIKDLDINKISKFLQKLTDIICGNIKTFRYRILSNLMVCYCDSMYTALIDNNHQMQIKIEGGFREIIKRAADYYVKNLSELSDRKRMYFLQSFKKFLEKIISRNYQIEQDINIAACLDAYEKYFPQSNSN